MSLKWPRRLLELWDSNCGASEGYSYQLLNTHSELSVPAVSAEGQRCCAPSANEWDREMLDLILSGFILADKLIIMADSNSRSLCIYCWEKTKLSVRQINLSCDYLSLIINQTKAIITKKCHKFHPEQKWLNKKSDFWFGFNIWQQVWSVELSAAVATSQYLFGQQMALPHLHHGPSCTFIPFNGLAIKIYRSCLICAPVWCLEYHIWQ